MINKPAVADHTLSFDSDTYGNSFTAVNHACEIAGVLVSAGSGSVALRLDDGDNTKRIFIAANAGESSSFTPSKVMKFKTAVKVIFEQGGQGVGGGEVTLIVD